MKTNKELIVVTGGAGFIGSHLIEKLIKDFDVISIDNYFTGTRNNHIQGAKYLNGKAENIKTLLKDIREPKYLFHLGEYSRVEQSFEDIDLVWEYNKNGIFAVLEYLKDKNTKLIYAGSSTKFGDDGLGRTQSPYAWTKATNTELVVNYGKWFNVKYAITYFYNVYGGREISQGKYATLIGLFKNLYNNKLPLTIVSPGTQERNFTHISDIVEGLLLIAEFGIGDEYGIGADKSYTIKEIAELFQSEIKYIPERKGNRLTAEVKTEKTKKLGWTAKSSLEDYINDIIKNDK